MYFNTKNTLNLILIILGSLFFYEKITAQGILMNEEVKEKYNALFDKLQESKRGIYNFENIPKAASLVPYCPSPVNQKSTVTCAGVAIAYWKTIREAYQKNWQNKTIIDDNIYSIDHIYLSSKQTDNIDCDETLTDLSTAFIYLKDKGIVKAKDIKDIPFDCKVNQELVGSAKKSKIKEYYPLFNEQEKKRIKLIQQQIVDGKPVIGIINLTRSFQKLKKALWIPDPQDNKTENYHAIAIIAYDDEYQYTGQDGESKHGAFQILNSWGKKWGKKGMAWIPYEFFEDWIEYGYALEDYKTWGGVSINEKTIEETIVPVKFDSISREYVANIENKQEITVSFQDQANGYIYAFYWPTNKSNHVEYLYPDLAIEEPIIQHSKKYTFNIMPTKEEDNTDYIYILYAQKELPKIDTFYTELNNSRKEDVENKLSPEEHIKKALETINTQPKLIDNKKITYVSKKIRFKARVNPKANLVIPIPVRLNLVAKN